MTSLLAIARSGDLQQLTNALSRASARNHATIQSGISLPVSAQLIDEALDCARRGDLGEAEHRLRLRSEPKFVTTNDCERAYEEAMREKRARQ